jgi:RimJ/RimL family protein N-acetyltransferase
MATPSTPRLCLETERLILRAFRSEDLDEVATLLGDVEALVLWGGALDRAGARSWIERNLARYASHGIGRCAVIWRATGELVGDCGLVPTEVEGVPEVELGWITRRDFWGKGVATEAGAAWRDHGLRVLGLERIVSMISAENVASRRVAEKLGFTVEREAMWGDLPHLMYVLGRRRPAQRASSAARRRWAGPRRPSSSARARKASSSRSPCHRSTGASTFTGTSRCIAAT